MGWRTVADVRDYSEASGSAYIVLVMLAERAPDETRVAHPGVDLLAKDSRVSRSTCQRALKSLEAMGEIEAVAFRDGGRKRATEWRIADYKGSQSDTLSERVANEPERVATTTTKGRKCDVKGRTGDTPTKGTKLGTEVEPNGARARIYVSSKLVTAPEWEIADAAIAAFNEANGSALTLVGTRGSGTENLKRIISRAREHPELGPAEHVEIVRRNFAEPWWTGKAGGVGVIYGPNAWQRALVATGRPTEKRRFRDERRSDPADNDKHW